MQQPTHIEIRGAKAHNLKNIDVDIPLHQMLALRECRAAANRRSPSVCFIQKEAAAT